MGMFRDADEFHRGSGLATMFRGPDGNHILRFEDFMVTNGPALSVLISKAEGSRAARTWASTWTWGL